MSTLSRRLTGALVAFVLAFGLAALPVSPASAATPAVVIGAAGKKTPASYRDVIVHGTLTCTNPTGQVTLLVSGVQVLSFATGVASATVTCAAGPAPWAVVLSSYDFHPGQIVVNASFFAYPAEPGAQASRVFNL